MRNLSSLTITELEILRGNIACSVGSRDMINEAIEEINKEISSRPVGAMVISCDEL